MPVTEFDTEVNPELIAQQQHAQAVQQDYSQYAKYLNAPDASTRDVIRQERQRYRGEDKRLIDELMGEENTRYGKYLHDQYGGKIQELVEKIAAKGEKFDKNDVDLAALEKILHSEAFTKDLMRFRSAAAEQKKYNAALDDPTKNVSKVYERWNGQQDDYRINPDTGQVEFATGLRHKIKGKDGKDAYEDMYSSNIAPINFVEDSIVGDEKYNPMHALIKEMKSQEGNVTKGMITKNYTDKLESMNAAAYSKMAYEALLDRNDVPPELKQTLGMYWKAAQNDPSIFEEMKNVIKQVAPGWYGKDLNNLMNTFEFKEKDHSPKLNVNIKNIIPKDDTTVSTPQQIKDYMATVFKNSQGKKVIEDPYSEDIGKKFFYGKGSNLELDTHTGKRLFGLLGGGKNVQSKTIHESKKPITAIHGVPPSEDTNKLIEAWNGSNRYIDKSSVKYVTANGKRIGNAIITGNDLDQGTIDRLVKKGVLVKGGDTRINKNKKDVYIIKNAQIEDMNDYELKNSGPMPNGQYNLNYTYQHPY